jgi:hypothetical protein
MTFVIPYEHFVHKCVYLVPTFSGFGIMHQEKSGNPATRSGIEHLSSISIFQTENALTLCTSVNGILLH